LIDILNDIVSKNCGSYSTLSEMFFTFPNRGLGMREDYCLPNPSLVSKTSRNLTFPNRSLGMREKQEFGNERKTGVWE